MCGRYQAAWDIERPELEKIGEIIRNKYPEKRNLSKGKYTQPTGHRCLFIRAKLKTLSSAIGRRCLR